MRSAMKSPSVSHKLPTAPNWPSKGTNEAPINRWTITTYQASIDILQDGEYKKRRKLGYRVLEPGFTSSV